MNGLTTPQLTWQQEIDAVLYAYAKHFTPGTEEYNLRGFDLDTSAEGLASRLWDLVHPNPSHNHPAHPRYEDLVYDIYPLIKPLTISEVDTFLGEVEALVDSHGKGFWRNLLKEAIEEKFQEIHAATPDLVVAYHDPNREKELLAQISKREAAHCELMDSYYKEVQKLSVCEAQIEHLKTEVEQFRVELSNREEEAERLRVELNGAKKEATRLESVLGAIQNTKDPIYGLPPSLPDASSLPGAPDAPTEPEKLPKSNVLRQWFSFN